MGNLRTRSPVAAYMALAKAEAMGRTLGSPTPPDVSSQGTMLMSSGKSSVRQQKCNRAMAHQQALLPLLELQRELTGHAADRGMGDAQIVEVGKYGAISW